MSQNQMSPYSFMEFQIGSIKLHVTEDSEGGYVCERVDSLYYENRARRWLQIYLTFLGQVSFNQGP